MRSIKYKILLSFCTTAAVILLAIGILISARLTSGVQQQSEMLSLDLTAMSNETLTGYKGVFNHRINMILQDVEGMSVAIASNSDLKAKLISQSTVLLTGVLNSYRLQSDKIDFSIVLDLEGNYIAASPVDLYSTVSPKNFEEFFKSSGFLEKVQNYLQNSLENAVGNMQSVIIVKDDFVKSFQFTDKRFTGDTFLCMASASIINDSFKEPLAVVVSGKILNNYQKPLNEFYDTTGLACAVYLGTDPIAHRGFSGKEIGDATTKDLKISADTLKKIYESGEKNISLTFAGKSYRTAASPIVNAAGGKVGAVIVAMPEQKITTINQRIISFGDKLKQNIQVWLLGIGAISLVIFIVVSMVITTGVAQRISQVVKLANSIANGDLSQRLNMSSMDEIGNMSRELDNSCKNLSEMIAQIKDNAKTLASSSEEMSAISSQMASSAEEMDSQSNTVAGTTEQMSASVNSMASAAEEMSVNIQNVSSTSEQMSQNMSSVAAAIEEMSASINEVASSAKDGSEITTEATAISASATKTMDDLNTATKQIGEVTNLIKQMAEQTNLLALNATIEAASAGDAGRGFAVVANEIKELAVQSAKAATDISGRIEGVLTNTEAVAKAINSIVEIVGKINDSSMSITKSVEQQTTTANEISGNVQQAKTGSVNIASAMAEIARGANDVSKSAAETAKAINEVSANIQGVSQAAKNSNSGAQQVNESAKELAKMAVQIQEMVGRFKVMTE